MVRLGRGSDRETICYHMVVGRQQVLVQFDSDLVAALDERAGVEGVSRSELLRRFVRAMLADDLASSVDQRIVDGYLRIPAVAPDGLVEALAAASIDAEPW